MPFLSNTVTRHRKAGLFETYRGAGQEGGPVAVNCIKTTKHRDKFRSLLRPNPRAARDIFPREGDLSSFSIAPSRGTIRQVRLKSSVALGRRAVLMWPIA